MRQQRRFTKEFEDEAVVPGILPAGDIPLFGARLSFVAGPDQSLAGISRLPDPKWPAGRS